MINYAKRKIKNIVFLKKIILKINVNKIINKNEYAYSSFCKANGFQESDTLSLHKILEKLKLQKGDRTECNIIGSGNSALNVVNNVGSEISNFTCNFGGLIEVPIDFYLCEYGSCENGKLNFSKIQKNVIQNRKSPTHIVIIKNLWQGNISKDYILKNYDGYMIMRDILFPYLNDLLELGLYEFVFKKMVDSKQFFVLQVYTSIITMIQLAVLSGYKKINVFGLDGVGPHFFYQSSDIINKELAEEVKSIVPRSLDNHIHKVGSPALTLMEPMRRFLNEKGIELIVHKNVKETIKETV